MDMLTEIPYLIPQDVNGLHYNGFINIHSELYVFEIRLPTSKKLCDAVINCDFKLQKLIGNFKDIILQRLKQCESLVSFIKEFQMITETQVEVMNTDSSEMKYCQKLVDHIESLGWEKLMYIDPIFTQLHLSYCDQIGRNHIIKLNIGSEYPEEAPNCFVELPLKFDIHWNAKCDLKHVYKQFVVSVEQCQQFWNLLSDIDCNTWILEPEKPTFSATHRRIAIGSGNSLQITVDPLNPRILPECKFLGSDQAIAPLRRSMSANIHLWDESKGLLENLQLLLNVKFPSPTNTSKEEFSTECGICYSYRMDTEIPDEVCNDARCAQAFHTSCLIEWLRALPNCRQSFNTIFGNCPYCEKAMTVKMVSQ
ncbi:hypothetical protein ACF0H5_003016 [Mactra antiquata]